MRIHALEATGGQTYAQMGRFLDENGEATSDEAAAATNPDTGRPVENPQRALWVTETALATALTMGFLAENITMFGIVVGIALVLTGIGFLVLTLGGALRTREAEAAQATEPAAAVLTPNRIREARAGLGLWLSGNEVKTLEGRHRGEGGRRRPRGAAAERLVAPPGGAPRTMPAIAPRRSRDRREQPARRTRRRDARHGHQRLRRLATMLQLGRAADARAARRRAPR